MFVTEQNHDLHIFPNLSTYGEKNIRKNLKINLNVTCRVSFWELVCLGTSWLPSLRSITLQVITAVWRLSWRGGQMWIWTFLTWAQHYTRPVSAKSWNVPGHCWGKVSRRQCVDLYIHAHTFLMGACASRHAHYWCTKYSSLAIFKRNRNKHIYWQAFSGHKY